MFKKKTFKLYTDHFSAVDTGKKSSPNILAIKKGVVWIFYNTGLLVLWPVAALAKGVYRVCFNVGYGLVRGGAKAFSVAKTDIENSGKMFAHRLKLLRSSRFREAMGMFLLICLLGWGVFVAAGMAAKALELKNVVVKYALNGNQHLAQAQQALKAQDFAQADVEFESALRNFNQTSTELQSAGDILNALPQKRGAEKMAEAGSLISYSGRQMIGINSRLANLKISPEGINSSGNFAEDMEYISLTLQNTSKTLAKATKLLSETSSDILPNRQAQEFETARGKVQALTVSVSSLAEIFVMLQKMTVGQKNVLVLFQNNNELRATGGFPGTFGSFVLDNGRIKNLHISSIYDLDGQLKEKITPPTPILNVNTRWYLRDSNWFISWPESAKKVSSFYEKEGGETTDLVIALTPQLVSDWLKVTGPIEMKTFGVTFDSENFVERMQVLTSGSVDSPLNNPKQVMADFFPLLLQRLSELPPEQYNQIFQSLLKNLLQKHLLLYARDPELQEMFENYDWAGSVLPTDRDSLFVASSNLGGTKTDLAIEQQIDLQTEIEEDGEIVNHLTITRKNKMPYMEGAVNTSFVRILVPKGSQLLDSQGFNHKNLDSSNLTDSKTDPDVYAWEKNSVRDVVTGTTIGQEAGKTFFGNWVEVQGGDTRTVKLSYKVPFTLDSLDHYSLLLQKQPGTQNQTFTQTIHFTGRKLEWKNFAEKDLKINRISVSLALEKDVLLGTIFSER